MLSRLGLPALLGFSLTCSSFSTAPTASTAPAAPTAPTASIAPTSKYLEVTIATPSSPSSPPQKRLLHPLYLRERDMNPEHSMQPGGQRYFEPTDFIQHGFSSASVCPSTSALTVTFEDGHSTSFPSSSADLLAAEILDSKFPHNGPPSVIWSAKEMPREKLYFDYASPAFSMRSFLSQIASHGVGVLRNTPAKREFLSKFVDEIGLARNTNWGFFFTVMSEGNEYSGTDEQSISTQDVAYSNKRLDLHVDNPYRDPYPQYQLLHCVRAAPPGKGGESIVADGFKAAELLRRDYPDYFNILATTKVRVQYKDGDVEQIRHVPCIQTDPLTGDPTDPSTQTVTKICSSSRLDYSPHLPPASMSLFYAARKEWLRTIHSKEVALSWVLEDGDLLVVDNGRVMHGREAFEDDAKTRRHLEGCYMVRGREGGRGARERGGGARRLALLCAIKHIRLFVKCTKSTSSLR